MLRSLKCAQRLPRVIPLRVTQAAGTYSIVEGQNQATIAKNGVGDVTITFLTPFARTAVVMGVVPLTATTSMRVSTVSASVVRVLLFAMDGTTAQEANFHVTVLGLDSADVT